MGTELLNVGTDYQMDPEQVAVANCYLQTNDINETALMLQIPKDRVIYFLQKREVKKYIDTVFLEQGYLNRHKIQDTLTTIIELKLKELEEAQIGSNKDIADLLALANKIRNDEIKAIAAADKEVAPRTINNTQINQAPAFGDNYNNLLEKLVNTDADK